MTLVLNIKVGPSLHLLILSVLLLVIFCGTSFSCQFSWLRYDMEYYLKRRDILIISKLIISCSLTLLSTHSKESFVATWCWQDKQLIFAIHISFACISMISSTILFKLSLLLLPHDVPDKSWLNDSFSIIADNKQEFSNDFDLRKPLERHLLNGQNIECVSIQDADSLSGLQDCCSAFLSKLPRWGQVLIQCSKIALAEEYHSIVAEPFHHRVMHLLSNNDKIGYATHALCLVLILNTSFVFHIQKRWWEFNCWENCYTITLCTAV